MAPIQKSLARRSDDVEDRLPKEYDPEDDRPRSSDGSDEEDASSEDEKAATEHYASVGKSKLRQKVPISLGPEYRGSRISRAALDDSDSDDDEEDDEEEGGGDEGEDEDALEGTSDDGAEEYDDPDTADLEADQKRVQEDEEIDSDEAFGESDEEKFKSFALRGSSKPNLAVASRRRPTAADFMSASEDEDMGGMEEDDNVQNQSTPSEEDDDEPEPDTEEGGVKLRVLYNDRSDESGSDIGADSDEKNFGGSDSDDNGSSSDESPARPPNKSQLLKPSGNTEARRQEQAVTSSISDAVKRKIEKGQAVRQQRKIHDGLVSVRMKMHKALAATNTLHIVEADEEDLESGALGAAEQAAVRLWNLLDDYSEMTRGSQTGQKRKRAIDTTTPLDTIWSYMLEDEKIALTKRQKTLDMWSSRADSQARISSGDRQDNKLRRDTKLYLSAALDKALLLDSEKLVKRSMVPRDCAPTQQAQGIEEDPLVYDDSDFYKALLKELVDQRASETTIQGAGMPRVEWMTVKEPKTRKDVDRKASRGRKMRFNVREKLVGFMAPEDRRSWEQTTIDRFFATLFGKKLELDEEESNGSDDEINVEEEGLRLFRS